MTTKMTLRASFTILKKQMTQINTAEPLAAEAYGLFYKVTANCNPTKPYKNPLLTSFARSVRGSIAFGFYRADLALSEEPQAILSRTDLPLV